MRGSAPLRATRQSYVDKGYWIELADGCIVGLRWSRDNGTTVEIIRSPDTTARENMNKFRGKQP